MSSKNSEYPSTPSPSPSYFLKSSTACPMAASLMRPASAGTSPPALAARAAASLAALLDGAAAPPLAGSAAAPCASLPPSPPRSLLRDDEPRLPLPLLPPAAGSSFAERFEICARSSARFL